MASSHGGKKQLRQLEEGKPLLLGKEVRLWLLAGIHRQKNGNNGESLHKTILVKARRAKLNPSSGAKRGQSSNPTGR